MADLQTANTATTGTLRVNGLVFSTVDSGADEDWFRVTLIAGRTYQIDLFGLSSGSGTLADPFIGGIFNSAGVFIPGTTQDDVVPNENLDSLLLFTPVTTGTYYIDATNADNVSVGSYALAVTDLTAADIPAAGNTLATVALGALGVQGRIGLAGDADWYKVALTAGHLYRVEMRGFDSGNGTLSDTVIRGIRDAGGVLQPFTGNDDAPGTFDSRVDFLAESTGTHTIDVAAYAGLTGTFNLRVLDITPADVAASTASVTAVAVNGVGTVGRIEGGSDADWLKVTLTAGVHYTVEMLGLATGHGTLDDPLIASIRNAAGVVVASSSDDDSGLGLNSRLTFTPGSSGTYFIEAQDATGGIGSYRVAVRSVATPLDVLANLNTTAAAVVGGSVLGRVDTANDVDWFRAALLPGRTYRIDLEGQAGDGTVLADPFLRGLYYGDGTLIEGTANDDFGTGVNSRVTITSPGGTVFIAAGGYGTGTGTYKLSVVDVTPPDRSATTATTGVIAVGGLVSSRIDSAGDQDWFRVALTAGQVYTIELSSDGNSPVALTDTIITGVYNTLGTLLPNSGNDDYGESLNSRVTFTAGYTGNHFIGAAGYGDLIGDYLLSVRTVGNVVDAISNTIATSGLVAVGGNVVNTINSAFDEDWFAVNLVAGTTYAINLRGESSGNGTLIDPRIVGLYNSVGTLLPGTPNDDAPGTLDAQTIFRPTVSGVYFIAAGGYGSDAGTYRLSVETTAPTTDVAANYTTTANVIADGALYAGNIDFVGDVDWVRLHVDYGVSYVANMLGAPLGNGTLVDARIIGVFDGQGVSLQTQVTPDVPGSLDSQASFLSGYTGNAYIAVRSGNSGTGTFKLDVNTVNGADSTAPQLVAMSPFDNATGVGVGSNLTFLFDEAVRAGTGNIHIARTGFADILIPIGDPQVSFSGEVMTVNPTANLVANTSYKVSIDAGAVKDIVGNSFAGIGGGSTLDFTTSAAAPADTWTLMVYIAGDNNLEPFALSDLNEMESVMGLPASVNIMVMVDRAAGFTSASGNWTDTRRAQIVADGANATVTSLSNAATSLGELNMGDGANLTGFIDWAKTNAPAQNYGLVIWDHGGGLAGAAWDDASAGDNLKLNEIRAAVDASSVAKFDIIGFDACQMAMAEVAFALRDLTDVFIGSEENEPGDGWAYNTFLTALKLNPNMTDVQLAQSIVSAYGAAFAGQNDITLSALSTAKLDAVDTALDGFVTTALAASAADKTKISEAAAAAHRFPSGDTAPWRDIVDFMENVMSRTATVALDNASAAVIDAVRDAVIAIASTVPEAEGLSINLPINGVQADYTAANYSFLNSVAWDDFLAIV
ncbi:clostripain-related cysteine peptidase [Roseomonas sp. CAU 1739]|uniref:clostripain-related cysteine peptidase n=1 Tax=Roseomonas sp. CAU 1739 TaxID=3140364 RepID=UPI00325A61ED